MKRYMFILSILSSLSPFNSQSSAGSLPDASHSENQFGFFYSSLAPLGEWTELESGTRIWHPAHVPTHWRPYMLGRWVWTDDGWYWVSNEPFGWITYHYGRWYSDDSYGWIWVPDPVWAPAWVEWRYDDEFIGWAPLPPSARFHMTIGIQFSSPWSAPEHYWNIVRYHRFGSLFHSGDTDPGIYAKRFLQSGRTHVQFGFDHDRIINRGIDKALIERRGNIRFDKMEVREIHGHSGERVFRSNDHRQNSWIEVCRPTQEEMNHRADRIKVHHGERILSSNLDTDELTRIGQARRSEDRHQRLGEQSGSQQREIPQETHTHENSGRIQERKQRERLEMRRELIQRYEHIQRLSPPAVRENTREQTRQRNNDPQINRSPAHERPSGNRNNRHR